MHHSKESRLGIRYGLPSVCLTSSPICLFLELCFRMTVQITFQKMPVSVSPTIITPRIPSIPKHYKLKKILPLLRPHGQYLCISRYRSSFGLCRSFNNGSLGGQRDPWVWFAAKGLIMFYWFNSNMAILHVSTKAIHVDMCSLIHRSIRPAR